MHLNKNNVEREVNLLLGWYKTEVCYLFLSRFLPLPAYPITCYSTSYDCH